MSMLLSDIHLPALITSTLVEHTQCKSLPWNNLDQLSCLWGVFTKCKKNIRDGFRLENLSWRLWYRQSILHKEKQPNTSEDIYFDGTPQHTLKRTRSLPDLSQWSMRKDHFITRSGSVTPSLIKEQEEESTKFYINKTSSSSTFQIDSENEYDSEYEGETEEDEYEDDNVYIRQYNNGDVSLLSNMLQQEEQDKSTGLRRCQRHYQLDQYFANAVTIA